MIILMVVAIIILAVMVLFLSKLDFNFAALSISLSFFQTSAIFASFSISWPPEVLAVMRLMSIFSFDVSGVSPECNQSPISTQEMWLASVLLPIIMGSMLFAMLGVIRIFFLTMMLTRFPIWFKRKFYPLLKPPSLLEVTESDGLAGKMKKLAYNSVKGIRYNLLSQFTMAMTRDKIDSIQDAIMNASITMLSILYMMVCGRSLEGVSCIDTDYVETIENSTLGSVRTLKARKRVLMGSFKGEVVCAERNFLEDNVTLGPFARPNETGWESKPISGLFTPTFPASIIQTMAYILFLSYGAGLPSLIYLLLSSGSHKLNDLRFGRKYGYLYKRYEPQFYAWETLVMLRKVFLNVIKNLCVLQDGSALPMQQSAAGMSTLLVFITLQAAFTPYAETHLDLLELLLLSSSYLFLFIGISNYMIDTLTPVYANDRGMTDTLAFVMMCCLIAGMIFVIIFMTYDFSLQGMRAYYRIIEGEGKYGKRQQLRLFKLDAETIKLQLLAARFIDRNQRKLFQDWINLYASEEQKMLVKVAFHSLADFIESSDEFSKPQLIAMVAELPAPVGTFAEKMWMGYRSMRSADDNTKNKTKKRSKSKVHAGSYTESSVSKMEQPQVTASTKDPICE